MRQTYRVFKFADGSEGMAEQHVGVSVEIVADDSETVAIIDMDVEPTKRNGKYQTKNGRKIDLKTHKRIRGRG